MIRVGIIGFGRIGHEHARWIDASQRARVAGIYDPTPARRAVAEQQGWATVDRVDALLEAVDAVLVSTPTSMHFDHARLTLAAGKHVMIEKPMTLDEASSRQLADLARERQRVLSVFHCRRWDIDFLTLQRAVSEGVFGRIINVESRLGQWSSCVGPAAREFRPNWRNEKSFGGGGLFDWGSHFIDQLWRLMLPARPIRVYAQLRGNVWSSDCDDFARVVIDFDSGAVGLCEINTTTTRPLPRWHVDGTAGSAEAPASLTFDTRQWAGFEMTRSDGATSRLPMSEPGLTESAIWDAFARACDGKGEPAVSVQSVLLTMRLLDAARESSASGRAVDLSWPSPILA